MIGVLAVERDTTFRWLCRQGDLLLWMRWTDILAAPDAGLSIVDLWELRDGDSVTITNRLEDLPTWFELHPTETQGTFAYKMLRDLKDGHQPGDVMDGPNLWRLLAGDRVVWMGESRPGQHAVDHILAILDLRQCALAIGESPRGTLLEAIAFGALKTDRGTADVVLGRTAVAAVRRLGVPRAQATQWALG
jgi:hypothetical protein